jgi:hypothetical protein
MKRPIKNIPSDVFDKNGDGIKTNQFQQLSCKSNNLSQ